MQKILTEKEAESFLEKEGFKIAKRAIAKSSDDLNEIAKTIAFPWAMKVSGNKVVHKAKIGGVLLNIKNQTEAQESYDKLSKIPGFDEAIIQEMLTGEETIIGLKKTPEFDLVIMFGKGGTQVEQEKDVAFRVLPINKFEASCLIKEVKFYNYLVEKNVNLNLIKENLFKISNLAKKYPNISELDINPLMANNSSAVIVDARIVFEE